MGSNSYTAYGNNTWTVPPNVYVVTVQIWGAGGGGGGGNASFGSAAGAGGAFAQLNAYNTTPNATHNLTVGRGGNAGGANANGTNGTTSIFRHANNANAAYAAFGARGNRTSTSNSAGGTVASSNGNLRYAGGNGAGRNGGTGIYSGSGGGSAGNEGNGSAGGNVGANATGGAGGTGTSNSGGNATLNSTGGGNRIPGAGGAGGGALNSSGGRGGDGRVVIIWTDPTVPSVTTNNANNITGISANGQGDITSRGGQPQNVTIRGFVYDTQTRTDPGNNTYNNAGYNNWVSENGSFNTGTFSLLLTPLDANTTYYVRAFAAHNVGYAYGNELTFATYNLFADTSIQNATIASVATANVTRPSAAPQSLNIADVSDAVVFPWAVKINASTYIANNASDGTTAQLTAPGGKNNATFVAGNISDDTNPLPVISLNNTYTEVEWSLILANNLANNSVIEFRLTDNGTVFNNYAIFPTITIGAAGNNNNYFGNCTDGIGFGSTTDKVAILNAALAEAINMSGPGNSLAGYLVALSSATNLSSNATKIATFSSLLTSALSIQSLTSSIGTLNAIASSVINITSSTSITATFAGQASQTINIGSTTASLANMLASASSSFTLQDAVAAAFLYAALASQSLTLSSVSDAEVTAEILAFCEEVLGLSATDLAGMQAIAQLVSAFTTTAGATAISTLVRTLQSTVNLSSTTAREKTTAAALSQLLNVLSSATRRTDAQAQATTSIAISSSITNLANLFNQMISSLALTATSDWEGELLGIMTEHLGVASVAAIERFITALSLATVAFTENMSSKLEFQILLEEHVALTDIIGVLRTVAASCADVFNIGDISLWLSATGEVSVTFQLSKGTITFVLTKPSISGVLTQPTITFEGD